MKPCENAIGKMTQDEIDELVEVSLTDCKLYITDWGKFLLKDYKSGALFVLQKVGGAKYERTKKRT